MLQNLKQRNTRVIVVKPPILTRFYKVLPNEAQFDEALQPILARHGVEFHDFSLIGNDERFLFNTDHLNRTGVLNFFADGIRPGAR